MAKFKLAFVFVPLLVAGLVITGFILSQTKELHSRHSLQREVSFLQEKIKRMNREKADACIRLPTDSSQRSQTGTKIPFMSDGTHHMADNPYFGLPGNMELLTDFLGPNADVLHVKKYKLASR